jgi:hypothetical protein
MEWCFSVDVTRDNEGFTSRKISGHLTIAQTRDSQGDRTFNFSADDYRDQVAPRVPFGFRPGPATFRLSEDKNTLSFQFEDEEMGVEYPPPGVARVDAKMDVQNTTPYTFNLFSYNFGRSFRPAKCGRSASTPPGTSWPSGRVGPSRSRKGRTPR